MSIYESIRNSIKPILYAGLATMVLTGCDNGPKIEKKEFKPAREIAMDKFKPSEAYFTKWGHIETPTGYICEITLGDMDGDGDLDIIVNSYGGMIIYENRIPQKKGSSKNK